jgi:hypothetical protein
MVRLIAMRLTVFSPRTASAAPEWLSLSGGNALPNAI